jgi:hypothetical protein
MWATYPPRDENRHKERVFLALAARGVERMVVQFSGGNDEGGVSGLIPYDAEGNELPSDEMWKDWDFIELLEAPIEAIYGSWAGDFYAYGDLIYDRKAGTVVMKRVDEDRVERPSTTEW